MMGMNKVYLMGNLTRDPERKDISTGQSIAKFGVAVNETYQGKDGEKKTSTLFMDVDVWGKQAAACAQYLTKGAAVMVEGRLQTENWESKEGEKKSRTKVRADRVHFLIQSDAKPGNKGSGKAAPKEEDDF